jgi:hypothetical protein
LTDTEKKTIIESLIRLYANIPVKTPKDEELIKELLNILGELI